MTVPDPDPEYDPFITRPPAVVSAIQRWLSNSSVMVRTIMAATPLTWCDQWGEIFETLSQYSIKVNQPGEDHISYDYMGITFWFNDNLTHTLMHRTGGRWSQRNLDNPDPLGCFEKQGNELRIRAIADSHCAINLGDPNALRQIAEALVKWGAINRRQYNQLLSLQASLL